MKLKSYSPNRSLSLVTYNASVVENGYRILKSIVKCFYDLKEFFPGTESTIPVATCKVCVVLSKTAAKAPCGLFSTPLLFSSTMRVATFSN